MSTSSEVETTEQIEERQGGTRCLDTTRMDVERIWREVEKTLNQEKRSLTVDRNPGWKTVRIFVSSTFRDFHSERDVLVKEVFPDLREWCESRRIHLIECDLRWGVPKDTPDQITVRICLEEINRCYQDNIMPYFINMTSERIGWIPLDDKLPDDLKNEFKLIMGLSVTEMEIVHAAYRTDNPNALFLIRNKSFLDKIKSEEIRKNFIEDEKDKDFKELADEKLRTLKDHIEKHFPKENVYHYKCKYIKNKNPSPGDRPRLQFKERFSKKILEFFKNRIDHQYPVVEETKLDEFQVASQQHEAFMRDRGSQLFGRDEILKEIMDYIETSEEYPFIVLGDPGAGKSSLMASAAGIISADVNIGSCSGSLVFYHFVGAVPGSTSLVFMLRRLLKELKRSETDYQLPTSLSRAVQDTVTALRNPSRTIVILLDAVNQFDSDDDTESQLFSWLPDKLPPNVKCVLSMITNSTPHTRIQDRDIPSKLQRHLPKLTLTQRHAIVKEYLLRFRKVLDTEQVLNLLAKKSSKNPLWLKIACEELRMFGDMRQLSIVISNFKETLDGMIESVLERFKREMEDKFDLLRATLCLLETSKSGLLEVELLEILPEFDGSQNLEADEKRADGSKLSKPRLLAHKWAAVYRNLRPFLRPFGSSSEGRLDFYHRSLSKVVRKLYLEDDGQDREKTSVNWHEKLANYFEKIGNYERKIEEYPYHLIRIKDGDRLERFLLDWKAFDILYDSEMSDTLFKYWLEVGKLNAVESAYDHMAGKYCERLEELKARSDVPYKDMKDRIENLSRFFTQAGLYDMSTKLSGDCLKLIESQPESNSQQEDLMFIYGHIAHLETEKRPSMQDASIIPKYEEIISYHTKAIAIVKKLNNGDRAYQNFFAKQSMKKAFCLSQIANVSSTNSEDYRVEGRIAVKEALETFKKLNEINNILECYLVKAALCTDKPKKHRIHEKAVKICRDTFGPNHNFIARISYNDAILYETEGNMDEAYEHFKKAYLVQREVFGEAHAKTNQFKTVLLEEDYQKIAKAKKDTDYL